MGMWSAAGSVLAFNVLSPKFANLGAGYAYAVVFANQTAADVESGTFTFEGADADPADPCIPGAWTPLPVMPDCTDLSAQPVNATITLSPTYPVKAGESCSFAIACPKQFLRVVGAVTTLDIMAVVTRLRRTA